MSRTRYAPITSNLLVRKGEAKPWQMPGAEFPEFALAPPRHDETPRAARLEDEPTAAEYERWKLETRLEPRAEIAPPPRIDRAAANGHVPSGQAAQAQAPTAQPANGHSTNGNSTNGHAAGNPRALEHVDEHSKRCAIKLSHAEYERLGIIAVKKEISRQQVLRQAIEHYLAQAKREYQSACGCLAGACKGDC